MENSAVKELNACGNETTNETTHAMTVTYKVIATSLYGQIRYLCIFIVHANFASLLMLVINKMDASYMLHALNPVIQFS